MKYFTFLLFFVLSQRLTAQEVLLSKKGRFELLETNKVILKENIIKTSDSGNMFSFFDDGGFVHATNKPTSVVLYDKHGRQVMKLGAFGSGPFEFRRVDRVSSHEKVVAVYDSYASKIIEYSVNGSPQLEFEVNPGLNDWIVKHKNKYYVYNGGSLIPYVITEYDTELKVPTNTFLRSNRSEENYFLTGRQGGMFKLGEKFLLAMHPGGDKVYQFEFTSSKVTQRDIIGFGDYFRRKSKTTKELSFEKGYQFFFKENSLLVGLFIVDSYYLLVVRDPILDPSVWRHQLLIVSDQLEVLDSFDLSRMKLLNSENTTPVGANRSSIFFYTEESKDGGETIIKILYSFKIVGKKK